MGLQKIRRPTFTGDEVVQSLTEASTAIKIKNSGTTVIDCSTTANNTFLLAAPMLKGAKKRIVVGWSSTASTGDVVVQTHSSGCTVFGSSNDQLTFVVATTAGAVGQPRWVQLQAYSTSQWLLLARSSGVTLGSATR